MTKELLTFDMRSHLICRSQGKSRLLLHELSRINVINIAPEHEAILFGLLDRDGGGTVDQAEFERLVTLLQISIKQVQSATFMSLWFPSLYNSEYFQLFVDTVHHHRFEMTVDVILVLNAVVVGYQTYLERDSHPDPTQEYNDHHIDTIAENMETVFTVLYCLEALLKIIALGFQPYFGHGKNMFDFAVTASAAVATVYVYYPNTYSDSRIIRFIVLARMLRVLRLAASLKQTGTITDAFFIVLPRAKNLLLALFCISFVFAAAGVEMFGGLVNKDPDSPYSALLTDDSSFVAAGYYPNNFNDLTSAMVVLFEQLVVNNWFVTCDGYVAVTGTTWTRWYFILYYIVGVSIVLNGGCVDGWVCGWVRANVEGRYLRVLTKQNTLARGPTHMQWPWPLSWTRLWKVTRRVWRMRVMPRRRPCSSTHRAICAVTAANSRRPCRSTKMTAVSRSSCTSSISVNS